MARATKRRGRSERAAPSERQEGRGERKRSRDGRKEEGERQMKTVDEGKGNPPPPPPGLDCLLRISGPFNRPQTAKCETAAH